MLTRRRFSLAVGAVIGLVVFRDHSPPTLAQPWFSAYPFSLGVASGDPNPDSVVLWTRIAPDPLRATAMHEASIPVQWAIATDPKMQQIIQRGTADANPQWGHSVHVVVESLLPGQWYWYQFQVGSEKSPIGRTRTMPALSSNPEQLKFAFVSCQHYEKGYFTAYHHLVQEDLDLVFHLGDYIYEGGTHSGRSRQHVGPNPVDLETYRLRYALYKSDQQLQAAHAAFPFICIWDDHEVDEDYAQDQDQNFTDPAIFQQRRQAAYQAYYEHLPLRPMSRPQNGHVQLFRRFQFGQLAEFYCLDNRQYRDDQPCATQAIGGGSIVSSCQDRLADNRSMLGQKQETWLMQGLQKSSAHWHVIAQQQLMAELKFGLEAAQGYWTDSWDGYVASRRRLFQFIEQHQLQNLVVIGGDIHAFAVADLKTNFQDPQSPVIGTEFVGTSISSTGLPQTLYTLSQKINPHIKLLDSRYRGYVFCHVTQEEWVTHLRIVNSAKKTDSMIQTLASFQVKNGQPGACLT